MVPREEDKHLLFFLASNAWKSGSRTATTEHVRWWCSEASREHAQDAVPARECNKIKPLTLLCNLQQQPNHHLFFGFEPTWRQDLQLVNHETVPSVKSSGLEGPLKIIPLQKRCQIKCHSVAFLNTISIGQMSNGGKGNMMYMYRRGYRP
jgi:hypothetical protein